MKKKYVNLKIQIVKVQLSDCIASSIIEEGVSATFSVTDQKTKEIYGTWEK